MYMLYVYNIGIRCRCRYRCIVHLSFKGTTFPYRLCARYSRYDVERYFSCMNTFLHLLLCHFFLSFCLFCSATIPISSLSFLYIFLLPSLKLLHHHCYLCKHITHMFEKISISHWTLLYFILFFVIFNFDMATMVMMMLLTVSSFLLVFSFLFL